VIVASASYAFLALIDMSHRALLPVFFSTPIAFGGLGLDPLVIGTIMSFFGVLNGVVTVFFFSRMTDYLGVKGVYLLGIAAAVPCFSLYPIINYLARNSVERSGGLGAEVWAAVGLQVTMWVLISLCYGMSVSSSRTIYGLIPSLVHFRRSVHLHRRRSAQQSIFGGYERILSGGGVCRACGRTRPGEFDLFVVD
jgi:hypothetical protein